MKIYEDYFSTYRHIESNNPESCTWTHIDSTGLAEVIDLAQQNGYGFKFNFYDEDFTFNGETFPRHRRTLILFKEAKLSDEVSKQTVIYAIRNKLQFFRDDMTCKTAAEVRKQIEEIINSIEED